MHALPCRELSSPCPPHIPIGVLEREVKDLVALACSTLLLTAELWRVVKAARHGAVRRAVTVAMFCTLAFTHFALEIPAIVH